MKDLDCRFIAADCNCHVNTCLLKKSKNRRLEERAERIGLKDSYVMSDYFNDACDKAEGCGFCKRSKKSSAFDWKKNEAQASRIAKRYVDEIDDDMFQLLYVKQQKEWIVRRLKRIGKSLQECMEDIDRIGM